MFTKSEHLYDAIYGMKNYKAESLRLHEIIHSHKTTSGNYLLDVACGTGGHFPYLSERFRVEGLDLDPRMLDVARAKHRGVPVHVGDMVDFDLGRQFDVVVSLFSAIAYVKTPERLTLAVRNMARHTRPGGVLIIEPYFTPQAWKPRTGAPEAKVVDTPEMTIVRMIDWLCEANVVRSTFHYLMGTESSVVHFTESHEMGLFSDDQLRTAFAAAGMATTYDEKGLIGRGLYIGTWAASNA